LQVVARCTAAGALRSVDVKTAQRFGETAVEIARQLHDERLLVHSLRVLCGVNYFAGEAGRAFELGKESVEHARSVGDDVLLAESLRTFVLCSYDVDPANVDSLFREAIASTERSGDQYVAASLHHNAATHELQAGNTSGARRHLERAAEAFKIIGMADWQVKVNLGMASLMEGDLEGAQSMYQEGLRMSRRNGDRFGLAYSSLGLACAAAELSQWPRAAELHGAADAFRDQTGQPWLSWYGPYQESSIDKIRTHLGDNEFEQVYTKARALPFDDAVRVALHAPESE
jgi:hypothetical protein